MLTALGFAGCSAQLEAQKRETLAAKETLQEAEDEMENIHFEKKQLMQQWQGTLHSVQRRDEALQVRAPSLPNVVSLDNVPGG